MYKYLSKIENYIISKLRLENKFPPLFIVGAPRSGTTLVYLHIINNMNFAYFPNISKEHPQACVSYSVIGKLFKHYSVTYESSYGIVRGSMAPSDGWDIFHRWFPKYDYSSDINDNKLFELKNIVRMHECIFKAPFANKNNSNSVRIKHLSSLFPNAIFLHVHRDIPSSVMSLLESREKHGTEENEWWGVPPPKYYDKIFSTDLERAVYQIWGVNEHILNVFDTLSSNSTISVSYEEFCLEPLKLLEVISKIYMNARIRILIKNRENEKSFSPKIRNVQSNLLRQINKIVKHLERH
mgnify:CR=1 FL=1